tara:strand:- start:7572 stop:8435 length:864 start_codon:yes stop_codon:yes gene_type:complete
MSEDQKEKKLLFDRKKLMRSRVRAMTYNIPNFIYEHTAQDLSSRLDEINRDFKSILILTKNKNFISNKLLARQIKDPLIISPLSLSNQKAIMIEDEENLPFKENSFDLILSDLMLHASNNLKTSLEKIHALLKPDGLMLCSMFGSDTLRELKGCLLRAEEQFEEKVYPRINPFADIKTAGDILQSSGFKLCVVDDTTIKITSKDVYQLIKLIRSMGENNYINIDKPNISRNTWIKTSELMKDITPEEDGVISTFEILTLTGWKYHADQPKPLKPGSAKISLTDFFDK